MRLAFKRNCGKTRLAELMHSLLKKSNSKPVCKCYSLNEWCPVDHFQGPTVSNNKR